MMSSEELLNWSKRFCRIESNQEPLAALLSTFTPDLDELNSWDITEHISLFIINGTRYVVITNEQLEDIIASIKEDIERDYIDEVPDNLTLYIDWTKYWEDNPITLEDLGYCTSKIEFNNKTFYLDECSN